LQSKQRKRGTSYAPRICAFPAPARLQHWSTQQVQQHVSSSPPAGIMVSGASSTHRLEELLQVWVLVVGHLQAGRVGGVGELGCRGGQRGLVRGTCSTRVGHLQHACGALAARVWDTCSTRVGHLQHACGALAARVWGTCSTRGWWRPECCPGIVRHIPWLQPDMWKYWTPFCSGRTGRHSIAYGVAAQSSWSEPVASMHNSSAAPRRHIGTSGKSLVNLAEPSTDAHS
jgi:hypothetical protein